MSSKSFPRATFTDRAASPLKLRRLNLGLRQADLGRMAGINLASISLYERGVCRPRPKIATAIAGILGVNVEELFPGLERLAEKAEASRARRG